MKQVKIIDLAYKRSIPFIPNIVPEKCNKIKWTYMLGGEILFQEN